MASENKLRKLEEVMSDMDDKESDMNDVKPDEEPESQSEEKPLPLFLPNDVILEVQGRQLYVNKQTLADSSPVFKRMFESDFQEKHMDKISLPEKKYDDFQKFLFFICSPEDQRRITDDTVITMLSLAVEYQVTAVQNRCESFLTSKLEYAKNQKLDRNDIPTLLSYAGCAERYNLQSILHLAVDLLARYDVKLLKEADVKGHVTAEVWADILEKNNSLLTTCLANVTGKGIPVDVTTTLDLISGMECESQRDNQLMRGYETLSSDACKDPFKHKLSYNTLVEFIIVGERFKLKTLLSSALQLAFRCKTEKLKSCSRYQEISNENKIKIVAQRGKFGYSFNYYDIELS